VILPVKMPQFRVPRLTSFFLTHLEMSFYNKRGGKSDEPDSVVSEKESQEGGVVGDARAVDSVPACAY